MVISEKEYGELILRLSMLAQNRTITSAWHFGGEIRRLWKPLYGTALIKRIAEDVGVSVPWIYAWRLFRNRWPAKEDLERLVTKRVKWSDILILVHGSLTRRDRDELVNFIGKVGPTHEELRKAAWVRIRENRRIENYC